jgi:hypothetical protein
MALAQNLISSGVGYHSFLAIALTLKQQSASFIDAIWIKTLVLCAFW